MPTHVVGGVSDDSYSNCLPVFSAVFVVDF
jgi:hypothetical protein